MFRTSQKNKTKISARDRKKFLIAYLVITLNFALFLLSSVLDVDVIDGGFLGLIYLCYVLIEYVLIFLIFPISYGTISYKTIKKVISPNILLFISFVLMCFVFELLRFGEIRLIDIGEMFSFPSIMLVVSLLSSIIAALAQIVRKKINKIKEESRLAQSVD